MDRTSPKKPFFIEEGFFVCGKANVSFANRGRHVCFFVALVSF
ncbi:hypothetical protein B4119_2900 [Parageobacillus caldoxylosilyticus]|uniref:Uncharacterized protein n=1 Tax=Saccharococcus caldoxylosilyticus TaxID=81408 RepID=A0A150LJH2_9BACL|nr:hypothetical protein B4119_2900 [Parageobacillus caldoxylosilyticus]